MEPKLRELITIFLQLNPKPADAQVHALAAALAIDKEQLEAVMYEMLAETEAKPVMSFRIEAAARLGLLTAGETADSQEVLDSPILDPDNMSLNDVALNDGDPTNDDLGMQEETDDDGSDAQDVGVGLTNEDILTDDGAPDLSLGG
jgi:hypothetical protein